MKRIFAISLLLCFFFTMVYSQFKIGFQTGVAINFQTVNSFIRNILTNQTEYLGTGQNYNLGVCYNTGLMLEIKIIRHIDANLSFGNS